MLQFERRYRQKVSPSIVVLEQLRDRHTSASGSGHESAVRNTNGLTVDPGEERALYAIPTH